MAGLGGGQPVEEQAQGMAPQGMAPQSEGATEASPEEQQTYNRFVAMAVMALSSEALLPKTIEMLQAAQDPAQGIAEVSAAMTRRVYDQARKDGTQIPGDIILPAAQEVVEYTGELAEAAGIEGITEDVLTDAYYRTLDIIAEGMDLDQEAMAQDVPELKAAIDSGEFDAMIAEVERSQGAAGQEAV